MFFKPLCAEQILGMMSASHASLVKLRIFETIDSTNQYLLDHLAIEPAGCVCLAEQQMAGRGRRGRTWFSEKGTSVLCSMLWRFSNEPQDVSSLSIAVSVMVMQSLEKYGIQTGIQLKWPNDILFASRKLAGILLERRSENIVIGIGLNVNLPKLLDTSYIDLSEIAGQPILERNKLIGLMLSELIEGLPRYEAEGLPAFIDEWRQHDFLVGKEVVVHMPEKRVYGKAQGINEKGELLVLDETQTIQRFCYGEVSVRQLLP